MFLCYNKNNVNIDVITEYINPLLIKFKLVELSGISNYNNNDLYVFIQTIPPHLIDHPIKNMILLNIEQISIPKISDTIKELLNKNIKIIDYSPENISLINKINDHEIKLLPYQYDQNEVNTLSNLIKTEKKIYDIVFVGWLSQRREHIVTELANRGFNVLVMQTSWGIQRDVDISKAKVVVNIHYHESYNIYEAIRCDRWTFAGMIVVSEDSFNINLLDIKDLVEFEKYDNLVDKVTDVLSNYSEYHKKFVAKHEEMIENLKKKRIMGDKTFTDMFRI